MKQSMALPVELLYATIEESIAVPKFLDPSYLIEFTDIAFITEYGTEREYWESERQRNVLRRVCKSFNIFLRRFEHRYIRMTDIDHGRVSEQAIYSTIRMDCTDISDEISKGYGHATVSEKRCSLSLFTKTPGDSKLPIQIITGPFDWEDQYLLDTLLALYKNMPHLKIVYNPIIPRTYTNGNILINIMNSLPNLQFINPDILDISFGWDSVRAPSLTTIVYSNSSEIFPSSMCKWELPALRHLLFSGNIDGSQVSPQSYIPILQKFGHQLRTLRVGTTFRARGAVPQEYWQLCPRLERFYTSLSFQVPPPEDHPLHTISVLFHKHAQTGIEKTFLPPFQVSFITSWLALRRVTLQARWSVLDRDTDQGDCDWIRDCAGVCKKRGIIFEDCDGVWFEKGEMSNLMAS